jgi:hypothetical protein
VSFAQSTELMGSHDGGRLSGCELLPGPVEVRKQVASEAAGMSGHH